MPLRASPGDLIWSWVDETESEVDQRFMSHTLVTRVGSVDLLSMRPVRCLVREKLDREDRSRGDVAEKSPNSLCVCRAGDENLICP